MKWREVMVTTDEELNELPVMSAVLDFYGAVCTRIRNDHTVPGRYLEWVRVTTALHRSGYRQYRRPFLPARVILQGDEL